MLAYRTTYRESEWAVQRWDWFNEGRIVEPKSFCQFWRTVLVWATLRWLLSPLIWLFSLLQRFDQAISSRLPRPNVPVPSMPWRFALLPVRGCWLALRIGARTLWFLIYPLRQGSRPVGRAALAGVVSAGERVQTFGEGHKEGLKSVGAMFLVLLLAAEVIFVLSIFLWMSWFWTLIAIAGITVGSFAVYGFFKSGALELLWGAAVVTHHAVCPPITIVRGREPETK